MLWNSCLSKCNIYLLNKVFGVNYYIIVVLKYIGLCNNISHLKKPTASRNTKWCICTPELCWKRNQQC